MLKIETISKDSGKEIPSQLDVIKALINEWGISKIILARKIGMNYTTFKVKMGEYKSGYIFTVEENKKLYEVMVELLGDVKLSNISTGDRILSSLPANLPPVAAVAENGN